MSKLKTEEREALFREQGQNDGAKGDKSRPPGMSIVEKIAFTAALPILPIAFIPDQSDRDRKAYTEGYARGAEIQKIKNR